MDRFNIGDSVAVRIDSPRGHYRTPIYIQGKTGIIESICGRFKNPERLAYGYDGYPLKTLYTVEFLQKDLWPDYKGNIADKLLIDIYEHWLNSINEG
ncbi:MAG: nitrile hydratase [Dehalococcoidia bacterium]|nr:nitrile hydratase [Dehalococcoidia bacterium]|tara:strand:+ start:5099 stop:5389 length:291 start_codon:yes stop_codon:yes gene_type:complete